MRLVQERPEWLAAVEASYRRAVKLQPFGGEFAGAWVVQDLGSWLPNLRPLARAGILEKTDTSRGGRRAYYRMPDTEGVRRALSDLGVGGV